MTRRRNRLFPSADLEGVTQVPFVQLSEVTDRRAVDRDEEPS
jgi:hypothetical protein